MPKAERYFTTGHRYHLTHRCHNRDFLFRFAKDRDVYREMLRTRLSKYRTPLLGYCITSNHVHLVVTAVNETRISEFMDCLEGDFAQYYNKRKKRSGAFWGGRYHAVAIEEGGYLWNCLSYVELNMVRAGTVNHPSEWRWCSYGELMGIRQRYRLIDRGHFAETFQQDPDSESFRANYQESIRSRLRAGELKREPEWTESLAAGGEAFVEGISGQILSRRRMDTDRVKNGQRGMWILKENGVQYA